MLQRSNKGENQPDNSIDRDTLIEGSSEAKKLYEEIRSLRESVESLKSIDELSGIDQSGANPTAERKILETEATKAAEQVIIQQARKDAEARKRRQDEDAVKEYQARLERQKVLEAQRRAELSRLEAERKKQEAAIAKKNAAETSRLAMLSSMEAQRREREAFEEKFRPKPQVTKATDEEMANFFDERTSEIKREMTLESAKQALMFAQKQQEATLEKINHVAEIQTEKLAEKQEEQLKRQQEFIDEKKEDIAEAIDEQRMLRKQRIKAARAERQRKAKEAKAEKQRRDKLKKEEKIRKAEAKALMKKAKKDAEARARLERLRLEAKSAADAELGGGIVNVNGVTINTEIKEVSRYSLRDFLGLKSKKERTATSKKEQRKLSKEREERREEARKFVALSFFRKKMDYEKSAFGKSMNKFSVFCERHKVGLLLTFSIILTMAVSVAGVINHYTAFAYSYNGQQLGIVKEKDDVLRITDLVQGSLSEDKNVKVVIDARNDISFERVPTIGEVKIDTSEDVLKRLTYMGDLNVKACGIYVNGKKVGAVENKETAKEVFEDIKQKYTADLGDATIERNEIIEDLDIKMGNTSLDNVLSKDEMISVLCESGYKETLHEIKAGETLSDIATLYSMTEEDLLKDNPNVDKKKLKVGDKLVIKQTAPILTIRTTAKITYERVDEHPVKEKKSEEIYEGYTELEQAGEDGLSEITSKVVLVNGQQVEENPLVTTVKKKAVPEIVLVGVKERPPSVGSGKYIWPLPAGSYGFSSGFKMRWGRMHEGIDLTAPTGTKVYASDGGIVKSAGYSGGYGYLVIIDHQNGMESRYAHNSKLLVSKGDEVFQGQEIALSGNTGRSTGAHLHFEIRVNGVAKDPMSFLP